MPKFIRLIVVGVALVLSTLHSPAAEAAFSPVSIAIVPPLQFPPSDFTITGGRVSALWGRQRDIYGFDVGVIGNITEQDFFGIGVSGLFNLTHGQTTVLGLQFAGLGNWNNQKTNVIGLQLAGIVNYNQAESSVNGLQLALFANHAGHTHIRGIQASLYNKAEKVYGVQIGLINQADSLYGLQIGLLNFNHKGVFAVSPILNVGF